MFTVEPKPGYFHAKFSGEINEEVMQLWLKESQEALSHIEPGYNMLMDFSDVCHMTTEATDLMVEGAELAKQSGIGRVVFVVRTALLRLQVENLVKRAGIHAQERFISVETTPHWQEAAIAWLVDEIEPSAFIYKPKAS